ncbi:MAG: amidohydrolase family protein [Frankiales bacterium]|nr:amidohydrolase family protein [Frankiales bacterium]
MQPPVFDAHRHIGRMPAYPFYGGPPVDPAPTAPATVAELIADLDRDGIERALVLPNYGVPDAALSFGHNELVLEACQKDDRLLGALWTSPLESDAVLTEQALALVGETGIRALKLSFLLGGAVDDPTCRPGLERIFATAREHDLVIHVHTSPGAASDIDQIGSLVEEFGDDVAIHLVHFGGGASGHIKLAGGRFLDWVQAGKRVYTDMSWAIGFAPRWIAAEIEARGVGHDRVLFASDEPWGDTPGEIARLSAAFGDGELGRCAFSENFTALYVR